MGDLTERGIYMKEYQKHTKQYRYKIKRASVVMFCSVGVLLAVAAGLFLHNVALRDNSVQVASVGNMASTITDVQPEQAEQPTPEPENDNPYGIDPTRPMSP